MPRVVYPGLYRMARVIGEMTNKDPSTFRKTILNNVKLLLRGIPPEELLSIFEEDEDGR